MWVGMSPTKGNVAFNGSTYDAVMSAALASFNNVNQPLALTLGPTPRSSASATRTSTHPV